MKRRLFSSYGVGVGSPAPRNLHQHLNFLFMRQAYDEIARQGLDIYWGVGITEAFNARIPDVTVFEKETRYPLMVVEIAKHRDLGRDLRKCDSDLVHQFPDAEYYVFDYETEILYALDAERGEWLSSEDYALRSAYLSRPVIDYFYEDFG